MKAILMGAVLLGSATALAMAMGTAATEMDTDGDGKYSLVELQAQFPELTAETFATVDTNTDGLVDPDELTAAQETGVLPTQS